MHETDAPSPGTAKRWNLFARELEDILITHHARLSLLDNRAGIHPEKGRRLQRSLHVPKSFPTLNPEELEQVVVAFALNPQERLRLIAAILATAIEETLMDRISPDDALKATEAIFPIIFHALQEQTEENAFSTLERGTYLDQDTDGDRILASALVAIDHANLVLHLSHNATSATEKAERARQAYESYDLALRELQKAPTYFKAGDVWREWYSEAQNGRDNAEKQLAQLEQSGEDSGVSE